MQNETTILQDGYYNPGVWELDEYGEIKYELSSFLQYLLDTL